MCLLSDPFHGWEATHPARKYDKRHTCYVLDYMPPATADSHTARKPTDGFRYFADCFVLAEVDVAVLHSEVARLFVQFRQGYFYQ